MGPHCIFTRVVKKSIHCRTIEEFNDSDDEDEEDMVIPNVVWYSADVVILVSGYVVSPLVEEHRAREESMSYPLVIIMDSDTEMEEDPEEDPDELESSNS
ncbi:hypothetical protein TanjilG_31196 [Lupinus angustifolius]|uniref:Uncharacterized protein n=1 Tax=Lupinus angustifolius TaxID=3871 RepID=A0A1J7HZI4_LUPAN|nr:hypothetical protein TanjilG_31196 [Lupinus angustifolius]